MNLTTSEKNLPSADISLVICTRNRQKKLAQCLQKISSLNVGSNTELIVVDNNSTDGTHDVVSEFIKSAKIPTRYIKEENQGTGFARNAGASAASAPILVYIDDDCYPEENLLINHQKIFASEPSLDFIGGRVELYDQQDLPLTILTHKSDIYFYSRQRIVAGQIISANFAVRKNALEKIGGWDNNFGAGTKFPCEDLDLVARMLCGGMEGKYDPAPTVFHHHERKTEEDYRQLMHSYDAGRGGFYGKCIITPPLRRIYCWPWLKSFFRKALGQSACEIKYAFLYIAKSVFK